LNRRKGKGRLGSHQQGKKGSDLYLLGEEEVVSAAGHQAGGFFWMVREEKEEKKGSKLAEEMTAMSCPSREEKEAKSTAPLRVETRGKPLRRKKKKRRGG